VGTTSRPPKWIKPQLTRLVDEAPTGKDGLHEIKYDGYRMQAARLVT
jgi:ATP-dependent DNA ligase